MQTKPHEGYSVKRIREMLGIKQDKLAIDLGLSQQAISSLEQKETLDVPMLEKVAKTLGVSPEAIKNFDDDGTITYINTFNDNSINQGINAETSNYHCTFNPIDKIVELYEALLKSEREKIDMLKSQISSLTIGNG